MNDNVQTIILHCTALKRVLQYLQYFSFLWKPRRWKDRPCISLVLQHTSALVSSKSQDFCLCWESLVGINVDGFGGNCRSFSFFFSLSFFFVSLRFSLFSSHSPFMRKSSCHLLYIWDFTLTACAPTPFETSQIAKLCIFTRTFCPLQGSFWPLQHKERVQKRVPGASLSSPKKSKAESKRSQHS